MAEKKSLDCVKIRKDLAAFMGSRYNLGMPNLNVTESNKSAVTTVLDGAVGTVGGFVAGLHAMLPKKWKKDKSSAKKLKKDTEFSEACEIMLNLIDEVNDVFVGRALEERMIKYMKDQFLNRKVLISFYGDSNVGKSTILNSIMGDSYLPMSRQTETSVAVYIKFLKPTASSTSEASSAISEPLCDALYDWTTMDNLASGTENIKKALQEINKGSRDKDKLPSDTLLLKLRHPFTFTSSDGPSYYMLDNPGCDEFGSSIVQMSIKTAQDISSTFIFVTTIDNYRNEEFSRSLRNIYRKNSETVKKNYLTIVINKMDEALCDMYNECSYTKDEVVSTVYEYIRTKVLRCSPENFPKQSVIPVCGAWALHSRQFRNDIHNPKLKKVIVRHLRNISDIEEFSGDERLASIASNEAFTNAGILEEYSNILELEKRIATMTEKPILVWKQKMASDIHDQIDKLQNELKKEISSCEQSVSVQGKKVEEMRNVLVLCKNLYSKVCEEGKSYNGLSKFTFSTTPRTWLVLKQAAKLDMQKADNIRALIFSSIDESLESFKDSTSLKITKGRHTSDLLEKDLEQLLEKLSWKINRLLTSRDSFSNLSEAYYKESTAMHGEIMHLRNQLLSVLKKDDFAAHRKTGLQISYPKLIGPTLIISLNIPMQLNLLQKFLNYIRSILNRRPLDSTGNTFLFEHVVNEDPDDDISCKNSEVDEEGTESQTEENISIPNFVTQNLQELTENKDMVSPDVAIVEVVTPDVSADHKTSTAAITDDVTSALAEANVVISDGASCSASNSEISKTEYGSLKQLKIVNSFKDKNPGDMLVMEVTKSEHHSEEVCDENDITVASYSVESNTKVLSLIGDTTTTVMDGANSVSGKTTVSDDDTSSSTSSTSSESEHDDEEVFEIDTSEYEIISSQPEEKGLHSCASSTLSISQNDRETQGDISEIEITASQSEEIYPHSEQAIEEQKIDRAKDANEEPFNDPSSPTDDDTSSDSTSGKLNKDLPNRQTKNTSNPDIKEKTVYKKWTNELEDAKDKIKVEIKKEVDTFFKNLDSNVILKFYQHYYDVAYNTLMEFDSSMMEDIEILRTLLDITMPVYEKEKETLQILRKYEKKLTKRTDVFRHISSNSGKIKQEHAV